MSREASITAVRSGGIVMHVGLVDNEGGMDARKLTLQEISFVGTDTYTPVDPRITLQKHHNGAFGDLKWVEQRPLGEGSAAFDDLLHGRAAAPKIVLRP